MHEGQDHVQNLLGPQLVQMCLTEVSGEGGSEVEVDSGRALL